MKKMLLAVVLVALALLLASCQALDVVGQGADQAFGAMLAALPEGGAGPDGANSGFALGAPDGSARLWWSRDFDKSESYDILMEFPAKPFLDAGLDAGKLPAGMLEGDTLRVGTSFKGVQPAYPGEATALAAFEQILWQKRDHIKYHADMDHFGVSLDNGNMFEWARDMAKNEKDIVFALNPQVFVDAGVDPEKVQGWAFAKVNTMEDNGRKIQVDKFLKPFNLQ